MPESQKEITRLSLSRYLGEDNVQKFIKRTMKCYKALRVLERNKTAESPSFSKPIEKLIKFLGKNFPADLGINSNLSELASVSNSK